MRYLDNRKKGNGKRKADKKFVILNQRKRSTAIQIQPGSRQQYFLFLEIKIINKYLSVFSIQNFIYPNIFIIITINQIDSIMHSYTRSNYDGSKFHKQNDMPTAAKSNYLESSGYLRTPNMRSPSRIQAKIQGVKDSIGNMISEMTSKKNQNLGVIDMVKNVNYDALGALRGENEEFARVYTPNKSPYNNPRQFRSPSGYGVYDNDNYQFNGQGGYKNLEQENFELRKALSEQLKINSELLRRVNYLQSENIDLKTQLGHPQAKLLRSTRLNSFNYDDNSRDFNPLSPSQRSRGMRGDTFAKNSNILSPSINKNFNNSYEGGYNNFAASGRMNSQSWNGNNGEVQNLFNDLQHLKRQNESLRQNTITLLQKQ